MRILTPAVRHFPKEFINTTKSPSRRIVARQGAWLPEPLIQPKLYYQTNPPRIRAPITICRGMDKMYGRGVSLIFTLGHTGRGGGAGPDIRKM